MTTEPELTDEERALITKIAARELKATFDYADAVQRALITPPPSSLPPSPAAS